VLATGTSCEAASSLHFAGRCPKRFLIQLVRSNFNCMMKYLSTHHSVPPPGAFVYHSQLCCGCSRSTPTGASRLRLTPTSGFLRQIGIRASWLSCPYSPSAVRMPPVSTVSPPVRRPLPSILHLYAMSSVQLLSINPGRFRRRCYYSHLRLIAMGRSLRLDNVLCFSLEYRDR